MLTADQTHRTFDSLIHAVLVSPAYQKTPAWTTGSRSPAADRRLSAGAGKRWCSGRRRRWRPTTRSTAAAAADDDDDDDDAVALGCVEDVDALCLCASCFGRLPRLTFSPSPPTSSCANNSSN